MNINLYCDIIEASQLFKEIKIRRFLFVYDLDYIYKNKLRVYFFSNIIDNMHVYLIIYSSI